MKKLLKSLLQAFLIIGISGTIGFAITCGEILKKIDEVEKYDYATMEITQIITTSDGDKRTLKMKFWGKNTGDKQLSEYTYPKRIKGVKFLMLNDGNDIWSTSDNFHLLYQVLRGIKHIVDFNLSQVQVLINSWKYLLCFGKKTIINESFSPVKYCIDTA